MEKLESLIKGAISGNKPSVDEIANNMSFTPLKKVYAFGEIAKRVGEEFEGVAMYALTELEEVIKFNSKYFSDISAAKDMLRILSEVIEEKSGKVMEYAKELFNTYRPVQVIEIEEGGKTYPLLI